MQIEDLIKAIKLDDYDISFHDSLFEDEIKSEDISESVPNYLKDIVAFANSNGGSIYIGVDEKSHEIVPIDEKETRDITLMIYRQIKEHVEPPIRYMISPIKVENNPSRYILSIDVKK